MAQPEDVFRCVQVFEVVDAEVVHFGGGVLAAVPFASSGYDGTTARLRAESRKAGDMKKLLLLVSALLMVFVAAAPLAAADGEKIKVKDVFHVPAEVPDDLGELNHGCAGGLYTLIEGTYVRKITTVYSPSQEAWDAGDPDATVSITGTGSFKGTWDNSENDRLYELKAKGPIRYSYTADTAGNFVFGFDWTGSYVDIETGEVADWWDWDWYSDEVTAWGYRDGTCGALGS